MASEMAVQANRMNAMFTIPTMESITAATNEISFYDKEFEGEKDDEGQLSTDLSDSVDENS